MHETYEYLSFRARPRCLPRVVARILEVGPAAFERGVGTLYGHLSRIDVQPGDDVARGGTLGLSGATGLAGGDHLHFAVLVGNTYVDPIEWWDAKWVQQNIEARIAPPAP